MTDKQDEKKTTKLTLGGSKLSLGNKSAYPKRTGQNLGSGSVVVEVKRGKAGSSGLSLNRTSSTATNQDQDARRLVALEKSRKESVEAPISTLTKLMEINQEPVVEIEEEQIDPVAAEPVAIEKTASTKKEYSKPENISIKEEKPEEEKPVVTKPKIQEQKKLKKSDLINMLDQDLDNAPQRLRSLASIKRARAKEKRKNGGDVKVDKVYREVILGEVITVAELASKMTERASDVTRELMKLGVMATSNQTIDADTAELIISTFGHSVKRVSDSDIENILINTEDNAEDLQPRAPIVTVMGHVDHGKTSLLDALKETDIVSAESGGITQHIGAYSVTMSNNKMITFIDTPGHEAFTEMRSRGAKITDIVVLVVAADDGIKQQTIEAISHAKAAEVPIIIAINKIDKPDADANMVRNELLQHNLVPEELGGDIMTVEVSAKQKLNLDKLEEAILLVAEMQELKANPNSPASGAVIETKVDVSRGVIATVIVQRGTLAKGDIIMAGCSYGRVKRICNDKGRTVQEAGPSCAVEVFGLNDAPSAGDVFNIVSTEKQARDIIDYRMRKARDSKVTATTSLEELFHRSSGTSKIKELPIIIKGDVHGSMDAIIASLNKIDNEEVKLKILHNAVGGITESDITLAIASGAIVIGFNVRANTSAARSASDNKVDIRYYSIIYNLIDDIRAIMSGMLSPILRENYIGSVDIREVFKVSKVGKIAGSYVTKGIIKRGAGVRLVRDDIIIHEGHLKTLKRFKEDVKEVREGYECGIAFQNYEDIKIGDSVEVFEIVEEQKKL
ncbi:MAG: translation initiation factor IF-2 [Rickettsiaceae bacterium]|nr:translation initiation factor IF-2 [Rickettsiaceae bacterium]